MEKWWVTLICRPTLDSFSRFSESLPGIFDFFFSSYNSFIIMGDFNVQPLDCVMKNFIKVDGWINLIKVTPGLKDRALVLI